MGDPAGIGPEVCLKAIGRWTGETFAPIVFGDAGVFQRLAKASGLAVPPVSDSLETAIDLAGSAGAAVAGRASAIVTGPIHKEALRDAGIAYPGHTEIFEALTHAPRACMMLTSESLTCSFVTTHVGLCDVPGLISTRRVLDVLELTNED